MAPHPKTQTPSAFGAPSSALLRHVDVIAARADLPLLDAGCGRGRNGIVFAQRGLTVIGVDRDRQRLAQLAQDAPRHLRGHAAPRPGRIVPVQAELSPQRWLFRDRCLGAILAVHFLDLGLLAHFARSLVQGGHLFLETFGNHGGNYLDLPRAGQLRSILELDFELPFCVEKPAGPPSHDAVTVKLLARKL